MGLKTDKVRIGLDSLNKETTESKNNSSQQYCFDLSARSRERDNRNISEAKK